MSLYECVFIARQDISSTQVEGLVEQFSGIIEQGGGNVSKKEMWGLRTLAYRINKNRKGHYVLLNLDAPSEAVQEMERTMRLNEDVMRYLTLRMDELEDGPSIVAQGRVGRDDRDRGRGGRGGGGGGFRGPRPGGDGPEPEKKEAAAESEPAKEKEAATDADTNSETPSEKETSE